MLHMHAHQVPETVVNMRVSGGELRTKQVFGRHTSLMVASRSSGYHSLPHRHDCEQVNYVQAGEIWVFVEDTAYRLRAGDFLRIPPMAVHWAWNRSQSECELIEVHSPGLILPGFDDAPELLTDVESETGISKVPNEWVDASYREREAAALTAHGMTR
jgi:mannose-6-phosphate isomerase-like protein (cupin superfamily)